MSEYTVTTSAELMENYLHADFLLPQDKFTALQTDSGASLLFSIGTGGVFYLTMEVLGEANGWRQVNLGAAQAGTDFAGKATVKTFGAAQAVSAGVGAPAQIHLGMVLNDGTDDHLYLSLGNSDSDLGWAQQPAWTAVPFNAVNSDNTPITPPSPFEIVNVLIGEATDREYIVVDIVRDPGQDADFITRYYIDASTSPAPIWTPHDLAFDVEAAGDDSCLGRSVGARGADGIYTKGVVGSSPQLNYTPVFNVYGSTSPSPSRFSLPGGLISDAIAAARNPDNTSDLYVAAQGGLYWFASNNQKDGATGELVMTSPLLAAVRNLYAYTADGSITVWGLNGDDQVFYLTCPVGQQLTASSWNVPLAILGQVDAISPFIDRNYSANMFFAHSASGLVKVVKSPTTGLWSSSNITLAPTAATQPPAAIHSYTTHIQVTDGNGNRAPNVPVTLTATNVTSVYINNLYYLVGPSPIQVTTDMLGTITIVELAESLAGTRYLVSVASQPQIAVNTMDTAWQRNAQYTTVASLQSAQIVNRDGSTTNFVPSNTSQQDLETVAQSNQCLAQAYSKLSSDPAPQAPAAWASAVSAQGLLDADSILVDFGDLVSWLAQATGIDALLTVIKDAENDIWYLAATIGDAVYHAVIDCVEALMAAVTWIYNQIKILIEDILRFLEYLFGWQDILVTHQVLKNVFQCLGQSAIDGIEATKDQVIALSGEMQAQINSWVDIPDFSQTASGTLTASKPANGQGSAPGNLGVHHFQNGAAASSSALSSDGPADEILNDLVKLMEAEGDTLSAAVTAIKTDIIDQFSTLTITEVIEKFLAIVADTVLQSTENVLVTVLDVFSQLAQGMMDVLSATLDIPVLSWLYQDLTGDDLSFLDVVCLVTAIPVTIGYKAAYQTAPFPAADAFTTGLIGARNLSEVHALFLATPPAASASGAAVDSTAGDGTPVLDQARLKTFGFVTGWTSCVGGVVLFVTTNIQRTLDIAQIPIPYAKTLATIACTANIAYVSPNIATVINISTSNWFTNLNSALTLTSIVKGIAAIPATAIKNPIAGQIFGFVETFINSVWNVPIIANIIVNKDAWDTTYQSLIPESIGNFAFNLGGILEFTIALAVAEGQTEAFLTLAVVQGGLMAVYGLCMIIAGGVYRFAPDQ
jgi:hypothetical protein